MSFECAKCHDHKYDPISQKDYFQTFAFFNQVPEKGLVGTIDASFADPPNMAITDEDIQAQMDFINKQDTAPVMVMIMKDSVGLRTTHVLSRGNYDAPAEEVGFGLPVDIMEFDTSRFEKIVSGWQSGCWQRIILWLQSICESYLAGDYLGRDW